MQLEYLKTFLYLMALAALVCSAVRILKEYERAVIFRLGKLAGTKGPGLVFLIPLVDRMQRIDLRLVSVDVPRQDIMTKDNVPVTVDAVVYFNITDPARAVVGIQNIYQSTFLIAQTTLRSVLGQVELDDLLSQQTSINQRLQQIITITTAPWGIAIPIVEIKEVTLPEEMKRAMAKQAETERERRALLIDAQGEFQAAQTLAKAGQILSGNPQSLQLRYLQTLRQISTQKSSTILFPFPLDLVGPFTDGIKEFLHKEKNEPQSDKQEKTIQEVESSMPPLPEEIPTAPASVNESVPDDSASRNQKPRPRQVSQQASRQVPPQSSQQVSQQASQQIPPHKMLLTQYQKEWRDGRLQPLYVQWLSTDRCQFRCAHCETTSSQASPKELSMDAVQKALDELASMGCEFFSITGGEPLLRPDIFSIARHAHQRGMKVGLTTNGQATEENLLALEQARFDSVIITLDGFKSTQNRLRGVDRPSTGETNDEGSFERGIRTIEFFHDLGAPSIAVSTTLLAENIMELPQLTEEVFRAGAQSLQLQPLLFQHGRPARNSSELVKNAFRFVLEARKRGFPVEPSESFGYLGPLEPFIRSGPFFCGCGWNTLCITHEGDVLGCAMSKFSGQKEGNIRTDLLKEIWEQKFAAFRQNVPDGLFEACQKCEHLPMCRGGCWLFRAQGLNPCFLPEAEHVYQEISYALYPQATEGKSQILPG
ncbi:MAG: SPFH domain-containing protein [bacterium]